MKRLAPFAVVMGFGMALWCLTIQRLRRLATRHGVGQRQVDRVVWAVGTALRYLPGTTCLCAALVLQRLLSRRGQSSDSQVGVARRDGVFAAHTWVTQGGRILLSESEIDYSPLVTWQMRGH